MVDIVIRLFQAWNENGIRYCHWKSTVHLDATMEGATDIDVLVDPRQAQRAEMLATTQGFLRLQTDPLRSYPGVLDFVAFDVETGLWIHLHLHYQLVLGDRWVKATWLPIEESVLARAVFDPRYSSFVVAPSDELYLFVARMVLKHRRPFEFDYVWRELTHIKSRIAKSEDYPYHPPLSIRPMSRLVDALQREQTPSKSVLNKLARDAARSLAPFRRYKWCTFVVFSFVRRLYRYWMEFRRRILRTYDKGRRSLPNGGLIIAFVGIDGSGKTSAIARTAQFFAQQLNVTSVFLGSGRSGASWYRKIVFAMFGSRAAQKRYKQGRGKGPDRDGEERLPWYYLVWQLLVNYDKRKNMRRAISARANGALVLSDRWPQSQVPGILDGSKLLGRKQMSPLARYVGKLEKELVQLAEMVQPDVLLRFRVSPEIARRRKPGELSEREAETYAQLLDEIEWKAKKIVDIDADAPIEAVDRQIRAAIWDTLQGGR